jgi:HemY protein
MPIALRATLWLLGLAVLAVAIALAGKYSDGHVVIVAAGYRAELSLNLAVVLAVVGFIALYFLTRTLLLAWQAPHRMAAWKLEKARDAARSDLLEALRGLFSGRFDQAEKSARRLAQQHEAGPELQDMGATVAAWAAFEAGQPARALPYLKEIQAEGSSEGGAMRDASQAYVLLADGKAADALPLLRRLNQADPRNPGVLKMKLEAELAERQWAAVLDTLKGVVKTGLMPDAAALDIRQHAELELIHEKAGTGNRDALLAFWRDLDGTSRYDADIAAAVARELNQMGCGPEAAEVIEQALERGTWDSALSKLYGDCRAESTLAQIERAEKWLRNQARDASLLLALGKLCMRQGLWGKAQSYLEASVALAPSLEAHMTLANLMERLGKPAEAVRHIRRSAELAR